jgi:hypothetical protein
MLRMITGSGDRGPRPRAGGLGRYPMRTLHVVDIERTLPVPRFPA